MDNSTLDQEDLYALLIAKDYIKDYTNSIEQHQAYHDLMQFSVKTNGVELNSSIYYAYKEFHTVIKAYRKAIKHYEELLAYFDKNAEIVQECYALKDELKQKVETLIVETREFIKSMKKMGLDLPFPEYDGQKKFPC